MSKTIIIQGSSNPKGNTHKFSKYLQSQIDCHHIDLLDYDISAFDYEFKNEADDFLPLIKKLITEYDLWIMASPVYWYSMSGTMKIFFDRISDLLINHKETGRQLRGQKLACLSVSNSNDIEPSFYKAFNLSSGYLGIDYRGEFHAWGDSDEINQEVKSGLKEFGERVTR